jgi:hypothetical protein
MLTEPILFVLGAGASKEFQFPLGPELFSQVVSTLAVGNDVYNDLRAHGGFAHDQVTAFREALFHSGKTSVDAFLEHRR